MKRDVRCLALCICLVAACAPVRAQSPDELLRKTAAHMESYLDELSNVKCTEKVSQQKLAPNGKSEYHQDSVFDYLLILQGGGETLLLNESRLSVNEPGKGKNLPLLVTNGFSTLFLVFHPYYRDSFRYTVLGDEVLDGRRKVRVHFEHIAGTRTPAVLALRGREYPLDLAGTAWLDPETGAITRIEVGLEKSMEDVGLKQFNSRVDYNPVKLPGVNNSYYFPTHARVEVQSLRQHWINDHNFADYKRFSVSTDVAVSETR